MKEKYNIWNKSRDGKLDGEVMLLVRKDQMVEEVVNGEGSAEMVKIRVIQSKGNKRDRRVVYVPPKMRARSPEYYGRMMKDTMCSKVNFLDNSDEVVLEGAFNWKEADWENRTTTGGDSSWECTF